MDSPPAESLVFPMVFQHFQQVVMLFSVDDQMHRALNCKCKSEDAGPWHGHRLPGLQIRLRGGSVSKSLAGQNLNENHVQSDPTVQITLTTCSKILKMGSE